MAETVLLGYPAVSKDTVMVTSMKADFFEKKVGVPGVAQDIPVCTEAELSPVFDHTTGLKSPVITGLFKDLSHSWQRNGNKTSLFNNKELTDFD